MIGKSGNRFSEKIMLKQRDEIIRLGTATSDAARSSFRRSAERGKPRESICRHPMRVVESFVNSTR
jgi:hypothetical protein